MMGFPAVPFRLCDFWAIHHEFWEENVLTVKGELPGGDIATARFPLQSGPKGNWKASALEGR
jgi:hypothetical protein